MEAPDLHRNPCGPHQECSRDYHGSMKTASAGGNCCDICGTSDLRPHWYIAGLTILQAANMSVKPRPLNRSATTRGVSRIMRQETEMQFAVSAVQLIPLFAS